MANGNHIESPRSAVDAVDHWMANHIEHLSNDDVRAVASALNDAAMTQMAIWRLAVDAQQVEGPNERGWYLIAMQELARSSFRRIDASLIRLTGDTGMGNFATEFAD